MSLRDLDIMARTLVGECRNQPLSGQIAVAHVIFTRAKESKSKVIDPDTKLPKKKSIADICLARKQFSCWNDGDPNKKLIESLTMDDRRYKRAYGIACLVLTGDFTDPTNGANHYHTTKTPNENMKWPPYWAPGMEVKAVIGDHTFLRG